MIHVLFPLGVRLTTILTALAFVALAVTRRDKLPLIAGWLWLTTFEAVFQIASLILNRLPLGLFSPIFFLSLTAVTLVLARGTVRPDWRYLAAALVLVAVWMATGFHLNGHQHGMFSLHPRIPHFDATAEFLNDAAKTLWALGFFLPLLRRRPSVDEPVALPAVDTGRYGAGSGHGAGLTGPRNRVDSPAATNPVAAHAHIGEEQHDEENGEDYVQDHRASRTR